MEKLLSTEKGFSLVELITVLLIVSVLAVVAIPKFFASQEFQSLGFFDSAQGAVRYAQKLAIAQRCTVNVVVSGGALSLSYGGTCGSSAVKNPVTNSDFSLAAPGVALTGPNIWFDGLGRPGSGVILTTTISTFTVTDADGSRNFFVEPATGYVHP